MDWTKLVAELIEAGHTQEKIATLCGVAQASVSDLARGVTKNPSFTFGAKLVDLHAKRGEAQQEPA